MRWHPSPLLKASAWWHAAAVGAVLVDPGLWQWSAGAILANHALLTFSGLWPSSRLLGPNWTRLPDDAVARGEVAITIDDGPDPVVTPAVLDLLDHYGATATFFCIGDRAVSHPDLCRDIVRRGHAVENHSMTHRHHFSLLGYRGFMRELTAAQDALGRITGMRPLFFRAPAGLRNPMLDPALSHLDLRLASWTRRGFDTRVDNPDVIAEKLLRGLKAGDILLLHDGNAARSPEDKPVIIEVLPRVLDALAAAGLRPVTLRSAISRAKSADS